MTVWGLAIHEQSRLIAVSTNLKEVTVFVHAILTSQHGAVDSPTLDEDEIEYLEDRAAFQNERFPVQELDMSQISSG